ncbi:Uncharacterized [Syntrophomonas zehnderi OL-4]|uniref:Uncharacterized n=1 Tax=Syntrophomonas zehnderi OL-4 TaxID=690567 RepID=A0A0E4C8R2_9FIRM|nr:hypothetical protein [Syntrophomonas zehnderi]CFX63863.1 Uncharacterized [Syntrophomonas zehnderi OL-4]
MKNNLLIMVLLAVILAMAVPFSVYLSHSETAFTYDNIIRVGPLDVSGKNYTHQ